MLKKILLIAIPITASVLALFFSIMAYIHYSQNYVSAYISSHNIAQRTRISQKDITEVKVPREYLSDDVYLELDDILDKYVRLSYSIPKGSLFYKSSLEKDIKDLANTLLMDNQLNYDIYTNEVKINTGNLAQGMYVDMYLTVNNKDRPVSDLLISNCRITGMYDNNGKQIFDYDKDSRISVISVAVEKGDVSYLNKALLVGDISIIASSNAYQSNIRSILNRESEVFMLLE